jgi:hypothetical protein
MCHSVTHDPISASPRIAREHGFQGAGEDSPDKLFAGCDEFIDGRKEAQRGAKESTRFAPFVPFCGSIHFLRPFRLRLGQGWAALRSLRLNCSS